MEVRLGYSFTDHAIFARHSVRDRRAIEIPLMMYVFMYCFPNSCLSL